MCVALHLVYRSLQGEAIPVVLPASLIHPSKKNFRKFSVGIPSAPKTRKFKKILTGHNLVINLKIFHGSMFKLS